MRIQKYALGLILLTACGGCLAAEDDKHTDGRLNGRWWKWYSGGSDQIRQGYLLGVCDMDGAKSPMQFCSSVLNVGEIQAGVTAFYSDPENVAIPVVAAMLFVTKKAEGASPSELETLKVTLRKAAVQKSTK